MRVLFVSKELIAVELCTVLVGEGHDVRLYIAEKELRNCYENIVPKTDNWIKELLWVGKDGLIVFDDIGYGKVQDDLRAQGYRVVGGCELGDRLEADRAYGSDVFASVGIRSIPSFNFDSAEAALRHVSSFPDVQWVVKLNGNGHASALNYVGQLEGGSDVANVIRKYATYAGAHLHLQQKVTGVEIGVGRYFNGNDWVGPIEMNVEHKSLMPNGIGPKTPEMGTLMWYEEDETMPLYQATVAKMAPFLKQIGFRGDFDINLIVSGKDIWPLEATARFGTPSTALQIALHQSPWGEFLAAIADGVTYDLKYRREFGVIVTVAVPPFPYEYLSKEYECNGMDIYFHSKIKKEEVNRKYFLEEVSRKTENDQLYVAGHKGCVGYVAGLGETISDARSDAYQGVHNIVVPKMIYRDDIGKMFLERDQSLLREWGWLR